MRLFTLVLIAVVLAGLPAASAPQQTLANAQFHIECSPSGINSIKRAHDRYDTDYLAPGKPLGDVVIQYRRQGDQEWKTASAASLDQSAVASPSRQTYMIAAPAAVGADEKVQLRRDLRASETFDLQSNALLWTISLRNDTDRPLEIGNLALPLPFNTRYARDKTETYTKRLIRHSFIGGDGSFIFWMRTNAEGPYLVMTPTRGTALEYFDQSPVDRTYSVFIHSAASGEELHARGGTWRLPNTRLVLAAKGQTGDAKTYGFKFRWAQDYEGVRKTLYEEGLFDVNVVPGMTVPTDLTAMFSLHTHNKIEAVVPEHPEQTRVEYLGERGKDVHVYAVRFSRLGENLLKVKYGDDRYLSLEFFVTEPLETLIKKRAAFLVTHAQHRDPGKWYNGLFSEWDLKHQVLRSPDDLDGLPAYAVACDDPALGKAPYIAAKNVFYPSQQEIAAVEYYLQNYVWGGLQETDKEKYPYAIYGINNWKVNRESQYADRRGKEHVWRIYDYPHVILLYYNMYRIAKYYPGMTKYLDKDSYLDRAFGTAQAFFTVPEAIEKWSAYETGTYNELVIPDLIEALYANSHREQGDWLKAAWEKKVAYFVNDHPYLYGSEYSFDSTGFESTHAFARYAMDRVVKPGESIPADLPAGNFRRAVKYADATSFLDQQMRLNLACRGWLEPAYYDLGSDYRASGNTSYTLSYMAQMGGWAVLDYALYGARDPATYLRIGYASCLSSWALLNSGTPESNYGYWYPGQNNDGGASGGFEPRPWGRAWLGNKIMGRGPWWYSGEIDLGFSGALRAAATVVVDDPIFGLFAYGGELARNKQLTSVIPRDGLRTRFHILRGSQRVHLLFDRDGFAAQQPVTFDDGLRTITFTMENRAGSEHDTDLNIAGLPAGTYQVTVAGRGAASFTSNGGASRTVRFPLASGGAQVVMQRSQDRALASPSQHYDSSAIRHIAPPEQGFFAKVLDYEGIPIKAPAVVADAALFAARDRLALELKHLPNVHYNLAVAGAELHIIGKEQMTSDLPEFRDLKGKPFDGKLTIDQRTRGMGGLLTSCGEENLLQLPGDRYAGRDICIHEFAHNIQGVGLSEEVRQKIREQYRHSLDKGLWKGAYAATNENEYFAELTMWYFGTHGDLHMEGTKPANGPEGLKAYDPEAYALLDALYSGRIPIAKIKVTDLTPYPPEREMDLRSGERKKGTTIRFVNRTHRELKLYWLDAEGKRQARGMLPAAGQVSRRTSESAVWLVADADDKPTALYVATSERGIATIREGAR